MALPGRLQGHEVFGGTVPLRLDTLHLMGMVVRHSSRWVLTPSMIEQPPEGSEVEDKESDDEPESESSLPLVTTPTSVTSSALAHLRSRLEIQELLVEVH